VRHQRIFLHPFRVDRGCVRASAYGSRETFSIAARPMALRRPLPIRRACTLQ
jgi:hypothetical protein